MNFPSSIFNSILSLPMTSSMPSAEIIDGINNPKQFESDLSDKIGGFTQKLHLYGIRYQETDGRTCPPEAQMHDRGAVVPKIVVSPLCEKEVIQILKSLKQLGLYDRISISVKSGGHGYFNGGSCTGIMLNLAGMTARRISDSTLYLETGCVLGHIINPLANNRKAVPHGDCFGVGVGGHFLTAGWDLILARRYGLGCQSVIGGRVVLWDGSVLEVDTENHPDLLHAMRGGAAAGVGVVTEVRLGLIDEPPQATWRFTRITKQQLETCVAYKAFSNARSLPRDISVSFRFHFEPDQLEPVCSFNIVSLLKVDETLRCLHQHLGDEVTTLVADPALWNEKSLLDLRMLPASELLIANPQILDIVSSVVLHENSRVYWTRTSSLREMARSFLTSISYWVLPECETMFLDLYRAFQSAQAEPARQRMYALIIQGGGRMSESQDKCSMPLGQALARFELHWDDPEKEEQWCRNFTKRVSNILQSKEDKVPCRPYRGDIWLEEQAKDSTLDTVFNKYDRRFV